MQVDSIERQLSNDEEENDVFSSQQGLFLLSSLCRGRRVSSKKDDDKELLDVFEKEKALFITQINNTNMPTIDFWKENKHQLPYLYDLSLRLMSIPSSSASIERLFSIAGQINNCRAQNMSPDLLIKRTLLKVNMKLCDKYS